MRFVKGPIPENEAFQPEMAGWNKIKELDPKWLGWIAFPFGLPVASALLWISNLQFSGIRDLSFPHFLIILLGTYALSPIHEYLHALFMPKSQSDDGVVLGYWKEKKIFFAHYEGEMARNRLLLIMVAPLLCISVIPVVVLTVLEINLSLFTGILLFHAILCGADLYGFSSVLLRIPNKALIRNKGWRTYWRPRASK